MKIPKLALAMGYIDDDLIAAAEEYKPVPKRNITDRWKWIVSLAACLCMLVAVSLMLFLPRDKLQVDMEKYMSELGLEATIVHDPVLVAANEMPKVTKEDLIKSIKRQLTVQGEITSLESAVIEDNNSTWYITTMTISVKEVISGNTENDEIRIVSGAVYTGAVDDGVIPVRGIEGCHVGMELVFVLKPFDDSPWDVAGEEVFPLDLGEYYVVYRLDREGNTLVFTEQNISVNLDDLV